MWELIKSNPGDVATWFAAFVAVISAAITVWWPWINRPQASWFVIDYNDVTSALLTNNLIQWNPHNGRGLPDKVFEILNDGDGAAFNVSITMEGGEAAIVTGRDDGVNNVVIEIPNVHVVQAGGSFIVGVWLDSDTASILIHWTLQPTRKDRRVYHRVGIAGQIDRQPWKPLREPDYDRGANLMWYLLRHPRESWFGRRLSDGWDHMKKWAKRHRVNVRDSCDKQSRESQSQRTADSQ